jgi:hypothetical protein
MSTLRLTTISNQTGSSSVPSETVINGSAKAWVNFNGTGTVAIRSSFNVSSITDRGTGQYTINFATALSDANYAMFASGSVSSGVDISEIAVATSSSLAPEAPTTTSFKIFSYRDGVADVDPPYVCIAVFR